MAVNSGLSDRTLVKMLAIVVWLLWIQVVSSLLTEVASTARRISVPRAPALPGIQAGVARLVAGTALLISLLAPGGGVAGASPIRPPVVSVVHDQAPAGSPSVPTAETAAPAGVPENPTWNVQRRDSYWSIAERSVGDGFRWREIRDANVGRVMPDGTVISRTSDVVRPGWILELPSDGRGSGGAATPPAEQAGVLTPTYFVEPGDSLWSIAEAQVQASSVPAAGAQVESYWRDLVHVNPTLSDPNLLRPGQGIALPAGDSAASPLTPAEVPTTPAESPPTPVEPPSTPAVITPPRVESPTGPATETPTDAPSSTERSAPSAQEPEGADRETAAPTSEGESSGAPETGAPRLLEVGLLGVAATAIAVGASRSIRRRRRIRRNRSGVTGTEIGGTRRAVHRAVVVEADESRIGQLRGELDLLAVELESSGLACRPRLVQHGEGHIDVLLDQPSVKPPVGWRVTGSGSVWVREVTGMARSAPECHAAPLLVSLGRADEGGQLHLDLEAEGAVALVGVEPATEEIVRSWVTELASSPMAEMLHIYLVGNGVPDELGSYDRVTRVESWEQVLRDLELRAAQTKNLLAARRWANTFVARVRGVGHAALSPVVALGSPPDDPTELARLIDSGLGAAAVVLVGGDRCETAGVTEIRCDGDRLAIPSMDLVCEAQTLDSEVCEAIASLVNDDEDWTGKGDVAAIDEPEAPDDEGGVASARESRHPLRPAATYEDPPYDVLVRFLGPIDVVGGSRPLPSKHLAVVAYIALHRRATPEAVIDAVWGGTTNANRRKRLSNIVAECRSWLGPGLIQQSKDFIYLAGPTLLTDTELFERRVDYAAHQAPEEAVVTLRGAVELLRGPICEYRNADRANFAWVDLDGLGSLWEAKAGQLVPEVIQACLELGDFEVAIAAGTAGLRSLVGDATVTEALLLAHCEKGDPTEAERVYRRHLDWLGSLGFDAPDDTTDQMTSLLQRFDSHRTGS